MAYNSHIHFLLEWNEESESACNNIINGLKELGFEITVYPCVAFCEYKGEKYNALMTRTVFTSEPYISIFERDNPSSTVMRVYLNHVSSIYSL